jgi:hypothetical protein
MDDDKSRSPEALACPICRRPLRRTHGFMLTALECERCGLQAPARSETLFALFDRAADAGLSELSPRLLRYAEWYRAAALTGRPPLPFGPGSPWTTTTSARRRFLPVSAHKGASRDAAGIRLLTPARDPQTGATLTLEDAHRAFITPVTMRRPVAPRSSRMRLETARASLTQRCLQIKANANSTTAMHLKKNRTVRVLARRVPRRRRARTGRRPGAAGRGARR